MLISATSAAPILIVGQCYAVLAREEGWLSAIDELLQPVIQPAYLTGPVRSVGFGEQSIERMNLLTEA